eukprot:GFUD01061530.1.p1 GENE.GFUD01061530.1~~GFUD01061530.1.p1  ORF type:complete len:163 (-),score=41.16 GFUD01061530.1:111-599(-)
MLGVTMAACCEILLIVSWTLSYFNGWSTCVKLAWRVPRATYFVDKLLSCGQSSVHMDTLARYSKFVRGLMVSPSMEVAVMCGVAKRDIRTVTGTNVVLLRQTTGLDPVTANLRKVRDKLSDLDEWRMDYLARLLTERGEAYYVTNNEEVARLSYLIDSICIN